jgi:hypothetical protein
MKPSMKTAAFACAVLIALLLLPLGAAAGGEGSEGVSAAAVPSASDACDTFGATAPSQSWYFANGSTAGGMSTWLMIWNPGSTDANFDITFMIEDDPSSPVTDSMSVPAKSGLSLHMKNFIGLDKNAAVEISSSVPVVAERFIYDSKKITSSVGASASSGTWYFAEGAIGFGYGFETFLMLQNPNDSQSDVTVTYYPMGPELVQTINMPPNSRETVDVAEILGENQEFCFKVEATEPVVAERTMFCAGRTMASNTLGATSTATRQYLAAGTNSGAFTSISIANFGASTSTVNCTHMTASGAEPVETFNVLPKSRMTLLLDKADAATMFDSDQPVVVERTMMDEAGSAWLTAATAVPDTSTSWYAGGITQQGYQAQLLLQNPNDTQSNVTITYRSFGDEVAGPSLSMAPKSRQTVIVNDTVPESVFQAQISATEPIVAECALYHTSHTGVFYFAEGYTGAGFQEWITLGNPGEEPASATITYMFTDGATSDETVEIPALSRATVNVNNSVGPDREVSAMVTSDDDIVAERPMYFTYNGVWSGGHDAVGANSTSDTWYFAEGYTGAGFEEWVCVLNPGDQPAEVTFFFQTQEEGLKEVGGLSVPAHSRQSFLVNQLLGGGSYQTSLKLTSNVPVVAERPMYFSYTSTTGRSLEGGHCVMGATSLSPWYYFAEGSTRSNFEEWLTIQNPNDHAITVYALYQPGPDQGEPTEASYNVEPNRRSTLYIPDQAGVDKDVSITLFCPEDLFLAERPMYFDYSFQGLSAQGGHCVIGADNMASEWFLAEGFTGTGFNQWICLQNPNEVEATVTITYYTQGAGALEPVTVRVSPHARQTVMVNDSAGHNLQLSAGISSNVPIVVERPMYFNSGLYVGGHDVVGYMP